MLQSLGLQGAGHDLATEQQLGIAPDIQYPLKEYALKGVYLKMLLTIRMLFVCWGEQDKALENR